MKMTGKKYYLLEKKVLDKYTQHDAIFEKLQVSVFIYTEICVSNLPIEIYHCNR